MKKQKIRYNNEIDMKNEYTHDRLIFNSESNNIKRQFSIHSFVYYSRIIY